jgi:glycosyltransferase involved in cell wall biosynthesis
MMRNLPHIRLVENSWQTWPQFRTTVAHMHLLLQPSYTESFNMVTADGVAAGVPSVVSDAIDWAPPAWTARADDVVEIARIGRTLLNDAQAPSDGLKALNHHNKAGIMAWKSYLGAPAGPCYN